MAPTASTRFAWGALLVGTWCALAGPPLDVIELNKKKLQQWRQQPELYAGLKRNAQLFQSFAPERRAQILALDQQVHDPESGATNRLYQVMENYLAWLERLKRQDKNEWKKIVEAPDRETRLGLIKKRKDQEWLESKPRAVREKLAALPPAERLQAIEKIRKDERQRHADWVRAAPFLRELDKNPLPTRPLELPEEARAFYVEYLRPRLGKEDNDRLIKAEGQWPGFLQTLLELAERHPPALPTPEGPKNVKDLPSDVVKHLKTKMGLKLPKLGDIRWPEFATTAADLAHKKGIYFKYELWPTSPDRLSQQMQDFLRDKLHPKLDDADRQRLEGAEGKWPEFPMLIQELARKHHLAPPWFVFPGGLGKLLTP